MKETEIKIQRALQAQAEKISPYENTEKAKKNILESIKKEETYMKKTNFKKTKKRRNRNKGFQTVNK